MLMHRNIALPVLNALIMSELTGMPALDPASRGWAWMYGIRSHIARVEQGEQSPATASEAIAYHIDMMRAELIRKPGNDSIAFAIRTAEAVSLILANCQ